MLAYLLVESVKQTVIYQVLNNDVSRMFLTCFTPVLNVCLIIALPYIYVSQFDRNNVNIPLTVS
jgi:hypothetical protein